MTNDNNKKNIANFPLVDVRVVSFAQKLEMFVREHGCDLPLISVVGSLETVKQVIMNEAMEEL